MPLVSTSTKTLQVKVVYYGPGLSGKTTNLEQLNHILAKERVGEMMSLDTKGDRTLFFDWMPLDLGKIRGFDVRVQLYTVPGQVRYNKTRQQVLRGADGIVFVADSQKAASEQNLYSFNNLRENLIELGLDLEELPMVVQCNKKDLPETMSTREMAVLLAAEHVPFTEAVAFKGQGVSETLRLITRLTLKNLQSYFSPTRMTMMPDQSPEALDGDSLLERILLDDGIQKEVQEGEDADRAEGEADLLAEAQQEVAQSTSHIEKGPDLPTQAAAQSLQQKAESEPEAVSPTAEQVSHEIEAEPPEPHEMEKSSEIPVPERAPVIEERNAFMGKYDDDDDDDDVEKTPVAVPIEDYMSVKAKVEVPSLTEEFAFRAEQEKQAKDEPAAVRFPSSSEIESIEIEAEPSDEDEPGAAPVVVAELRQEHITKESPLPTPKAEGEQSLPVEEELIEISHVDEISQVEEIVVEEEEEINAPVVDVDPIAPDSAEVATLLEMERLISRNTELERLLKESEGVREDHLDDLRQQEARIIDLEKEVARLTSLITQVSELLQKA